MARPDRSQHRPQLNRQPMTGTAGHRCPVSSPYTVNQSSSHRAHGLQGFAQIDPYKMTTSSETTHRPTPQYSPLDRAHDNNGIFGYARQSVHNRNSHGTGQNSLDIPNPPQTPHQSNEDVLGNDPFSMRTSWILDDLSNPNELKNDGFPYRMEHFLQKDAREEYKKNPNKYDAYFRPLVAEIIDGTALKFPNFKKSDYNDLGNQN